LTPPRASAILLGVISVGVQTWGPDVVALTDAEVDRELRRFCATCAIEDGGNDGLLATALVGTADAVAERIAQYAAAGATHLMLGFADFPATGMVEVFAERVLPLLAARR
jgi:alkanesulfonate monooxygenase SsuD/methylene tetrahydromethanopterin reductase-like flavin-dependent oxidoreductase (luciferase family)